MKAELKAWHGLLAGGALLAALVGLVARNEVARSQIKATFTVGDVHAVHSDVRVAGHEVRGRARISDGDALETGPDGRARLRLDDGTLVVVDAKTRLRLSGVRLTLAGGRIFVQGDAGSRSEVDVGGVHTAVSSSAAAFDARDANGKIYCAQGELVLNGAGQQAHVRSGETAQLQGGKVAVAPEKAFDDWTGGLAVPWAGDADGQSAIPELRAGAGSADPGAPLVVRSERVDVQIDGELAITKTRTSFFNGSDREVRADARLAIPAGAILTRVARSHGKPGEGEEDASLRIARQPADGSFPPVSARLEWAGGGWLRGDLPGIAAGDSLDLLVEYAEWLPTRGDRATYRFPMAGGSEPPVIGELDVHVDAERTRTPWLAATSGALVEHRQVDLRKADARVAGDLVVELAPAQVTPGVARAYVAQGPPGEDPYVMVRAEVPEKAEAGVTLAVVLDTSASVSAATLDTERFVLDAILEGLSPRDSLVVLAADQSVRAVGAETPKPVDAALRAELRKSLAAVRVGGASNLGAALERAADVLDAPARGALAGSGMVVYIGDGRPTVGEPDAEHIRRLLSRRAGGIPRIAAVAVGAGADRWLLARLAVGAGTVYEVVDRADAARAGAALLADALEPTLRDVNLDLGPTIDRIYPREARASLAGSTVSVVGRLRGTLPSKIGMQFRDGGRLIADARPLYRMTLPAGADVPARWAAARIEELAARGEGLEPAITLAASARLLTPWTSWFFGDLGASASLSSPFAWRVLELSPLLDAPFAPYVEGRLPSGSTLLEPERPSGGGVSLKEAAEKAIRRVLNQATNAVRACRDARAAVRPDVVSSFDLDLSVNGDGHATNVRVALRSGESDAVLVRCVKSVVESLPYFASGVTLSLQHTLTVPEGRGARRTTCSAASKLSLPVRRSVWRARSLVGAPAYVKAAAACELPAWSDRRDLLLLLLENLSSVARLQLATELDAAGEGDAAAFVRKETLRRVSSFAELASLSRIIMDSEPEIDGELDKAYRAAKSDRARLDVVRRFLRLAPHSALARRRLLALLEALGEKAQLADEIEHARSDPFADAGLLAQGASALRRLGFDAESRRAFGELIERAPGDPWTLAYVGDRLRAEGLFDDAVDAYESLARALPNDVGASLRLALAHAGAGRLDVATRLLERVTQSGGRGDDGRLGELSAIAQAVLLAGARSPSAPPDTESELVRRLLQTPLPDVASVVMVQAPPSDDPLDVRIVRDRTAHDQDAPDFDARSLGLIAMRIERGDRGAKLLIRRSSELGPTLPMHAKVAVLVLADDRAESRLVTRDVEIAADGKDVELRWNGEALL